MPILVDPDRFNRAVVSVLAAALSCHDQYGTEIRTPWPLWSEGGVRVTTDAVLKAIAEIVGAAGPVTVRFPGADT